jgi:MFS family permease
MVNTINVIFRAFQGIGGAEIFALTMVIVMELTPKIDPVAGTLNFVYVIASAVRVRGQIVD